LYKEVEHRGDKDRQGTALFSTASFPACLPACLPPPLFFPPLRTSRQTRAPARRREISAERGEKEKEKERAGGGGREKKNRKRKREGKRAAAIFLGISRV